MNMHPVGTFIATPPTVYSKVATGLVPTAPAACACDGLLNSTAAAAAEAVTSRDKECGAMLGSFPCGETQ
ncbi:hypothetical protein ACWGI0_27995 [Streptomyces sp. NPDC054802]